MSARMGCLNASWTIHPSLSIATTGSSRPIKIKNIRPLPDYMLHVIFDDGKDILYDVKDDIQALEGYKDLENITGLFQQAQLDHSRTCVFWNHT